MRLGFHSKSVEISRSLETSLFSEMLLIHQLGVVFQLKNWHFKMTDEYNFGNTVESTCAEWHQCKKAFGVRFLRYSLYVFLLSL